MKLARLASLALFVLASACATSKSASLAATTSSAAGPAVPAPGPAIPPQRDPPGDELVGKPAPDFTAVAQDGKSVHLSALRGRWTVLYFYPKDETPGCTREACSFRDAWQAIAETGAVLIGISADTSESHRAFVEHYKLPFLLVSDPDGSIGQSYGVPFAGHHQRQTIVIGSDGTVRRVYRKVNVTEHAAQILDDLHQASRPDGGYSTTVPGH
jgi:peroxiredoxin Q/BCP